ncbi:LpxI family protein [Planctomycetota bacterium]
MDTKTNNRVLGLIAGSGRLPYMVAEGAHKAGLRVICVGLVGNAEPGLATVADQYYTVSLARIGSWIRKLRHHGVSSTIMVGRVSKAKLHSPRLIMRYLPDWRALRIYYWRLRSKGIQTDLFLSALADELDSGGIHLENSTMYCQDHLADQGMMTQCPLSGFVQADIEYGWDIAKKLGEFDIGQAVIVREKEIVAVEAIEGTAEMIKRAGKYCRAGNWTLIKTAKPNQDMRFDVPCVGPDTIQGVADNGGKCIVIEAGKTILIDKPDTLTLANKLGIAIIGC